MFKTLLNMHTKAIEKMDYEKANGVRDALIALNKNDPLSNEKKFFKNVLILLIIYNLIIRQ